MQDLKKLRKINFKNTKEKLIKSVTDDILIVQAVNHLDDLTKVINILSKDLREWYSYHNPEFSKLTTDHNEFAKAIANNSDKKTKDSVGADLSKENMEPIINLSRMIIKMFSLKETQEKYTESIMKKVCPNITAIAGAIIGAKLLRQAGSLKKMMLMPASTIQLLGAEEALFRHLKTGAKCPRHGLIVNHPLIAKASQKDHGKIARLLANKISIAVKVDYAKGKFIGDKFMKEIEEKVIKIKN